MGSENIITFDGSQVHDVNEENIEQERTNEQEQIINNDHNAGDENFMVFDDDYDDEDDDDDCSKPNPNYCAYIPEVISDPLPFSFAKVE